MLFIPLIRRKMKMIEVRYFLLTVVSIVGVVWLLSGMSNFEKCNKSKHESSLLNSNNNNNKDEFKFSISYKTDELDDAKIDSSIQKGETVYSRQTPFIFIGGVPRSGTTLIRTMLDAHPDVRCGEETRIVPRLLSMRSMWSSAKTERERLDNAGITDEIMDAAVASFMLEVIVRHGQQVKHLCDKDPLILRYSTYVSNLFPKSKFILMIRDGRATVHSIITRKVSITGFDLTSYRDCLRRWNMIIENMLLQCYNLGAETCMPVYYEQLVLHPEKTMRSILEYLNIEWNDSVLHHEKFIGDKISLSKVERSSDQVIKPVNLDALTSWVGHIPEDVLADMEKIAPMLRRLGYDPLANPPNYGDADSKIKENTFNIRENKEFWDYLSKKYSVHV